MSVKKFSKKLTELLTVITLKTIRVTIRQKEVKNMVITSSLPFPLAAATS